MWLFDRPCVACLADSQGAAFCLDCALDLEKPTRHGNTMAAWSYEGAVQKAITAWKDSAHTWRDAALIDASLQRLKPWLDELRWEVVVVVPPSPLRLLIRAFHPPDAFAQHIARAYDTPFAARALVRLDFAKQRGASSTERAVAPRFALSPFFGRVVRHRRVLLVDDVLTTGATLRRAETVLSACGASMVAQIVVARVPKRRPG